MKRSGIHNKAAYWTLTLGLVPILYLLSAPALWYGILSTSDEPPWLRTYCKPYEMLRDNTLLKRPLNAYEHLCYQATFYSLYGEWGP